MSESSASHIPYVAIVLLAPVFFFAVCFGLLFVSNDYACLVPKKRFLFESLNKASVISFFVSLIVAGCFRELRALAILVAILSGGWRVGWALMYALLGAGMAGGIGGGH